MPRHEIAPIILPDPRTRIITECIEDALDDLERLLVAWLALKNAAEHFREGRVTLCDHGCALDILALIPGFEPHSEEVVAQRARELAEEREDS